MQTTWILVCDASRARIFATEGREGEWLLLRELSHPRSRAHDADLTTDRFGMTQHGGRARAGFRGERSTRAYEPSTYPKETEAQHFAQILAGALDEGRVRGAFERLVLVAPPHFLGLLRAELSDPLEKTVVASLDKDYTQEQARALPERLEEYVFEAAGA